MTWTLTKSVRFEAAHQLPHSPGKCGRMHGHSFKVTLIIRGSELHASGPEAGMVKDYNTFGGIAKRFVDETLDHRTLNDINGLDNPTAEILARWLYEKLRVQIGPDLIGIRVSETCTSEVEFRAE